MVTPCLLAQQMFLDGVAAFWILLSCLFFWSCSFSFVKTCYKICGEEIYKLQERIGGYRMTFQKWKLFFKIPIFWCRKWKLFFKIPIFWCRKWKLFFKIPIFLSNSLVGVPGLLHLHQQELLVFFILLWKGLFFVNFRMNFSLVFILISQHIGF